MKNYFYYLLIFNYQHTLTMKCYHDAIMEGRIEWFVGKKFFDRNFTMKNVVFITLEQGGKWIIV